MSPIHVAIMNALLRRRVCSKCGKATVVPTSKARETIRCPHCGADLPVPKR